jgi:hypothetical protein
MIIRTFFDKNNTIQYNDLTNTGLNPIAELFYGGNTIKSKYSRFLFYFNEDRILNMYTGGTMPDLSKMKHTLNLTNTSAFDKELLNGQTSDGKDRASSFKLILFKINQDWDEGVGYDYIPTTYTAGNGNTSSIGASNWTQAQTNISWENGNGVYSGSASGVTIQTINFDKGNENIEVDITDTVNDWLSGGSRNYGLGLAYTRLFEETPSDSYQYVGFFTRHTQTFFEPYIETKYTEQILDDRNKFYLDKPNKLFLYTNLGGEPTNLDTLPSVTIKDNNDVVISAITAVTQVTKGVYSVDVMIPTTNQYTNQLMFTDIWSGLTINGINRPPVELSFELKNSNHYYNIGDDESLPRKFAFSASGIKRGEKIVRGNVRRVSISARIQYTVDQQQIIDSIQYRLYVKEGQGEFTVIDWDNIHRTATSNYFLLDTNGLIPQTYYMDIKAISNNEVTINKETISFDIVDIVKYK